MKATTPTSPRRDTLNLRIPVTARNLIDRAAETSGKTRTDFILEAARRAAEDVLLDRAIFAMSPEIYAEFLARLDAKPQPNQRLQKTMRKPVPWKTPPGASFAPRRRLALEACLYTPFLTKRKPSIFALVWSYPRLSQ